MLTPEAMRRRAVTTSTLGALTFHNGSILPFTNTYAIFWGTPWGTDTAFTTDKITGLTSFLQGFGGSNYARLVTEYYGFEPCVSCVLESHVIPVSTYRGSFIDNRPAPQGEPTAETVNGEVCTVLNQNGVSPIALAFYAVYATTLSDSLCGWHSYGNCGGIPIEFGFFFDLDSTCSTGDHSGLHSPGLAALANTTAHELSEAITDPTVGGGWYAGDIGGENGDKCNFVFDPAVPLVTLSNGARFKLQGEWSNKAFGGGYGRKNADNEAGCLNGETWPHVMVNIGTGPNEVQTQAQCTWNSSVVGGTAPYTYSWQAFGSTVPPTGTQPNFTAETYNAGDFQLAVKVQDAAGKRDSTTWRVLAVNNGVGCATM